MNESQVIVIGAGVGGLISAALLAARGVPVLLLEASDAPGGKMRQVTVDGAAIDGGPTVFTMRPVFDAIFAECGARLDDYVTLRPASILARHAWGDDRLDLFADPQASEDAIGAFAGAAEALGYRAFRAEAQRIFQTLDAPFLRRGQTNPIGLTLRMGARGFADLCAIRPYETLWKALGEHFRDPRLRQLFGRYATYCGSSPFLCPATLMLIAHVEASGVWLVEGGMHGFARALETLARCLGVDIRYGEKVVGITVGQGRANGVTLASGDQVPARAIVCNADPAALADGLFGQAVRRAVPAVPRDRRSLAAMVWTARAGATGFPLSRHNVFFSDDYPAEFAALSAGHLADRPSVYVCAQDRDDGGTLTCGDMAERVQIIVNAPPTGDTHPLTPAEIDRCTVRMLECLARAGLMLDLPPASTQLTTPTDFAAMYPSTGGALYGPASHGWAASFRRPGARTRIPGLYCAGGSTHPGAGVPMAALSGSQAAACLLKDQPLTSMSRRTAMPGGTSTPSARTAASA
ncbi:1-hydroxycarotenoid 3,4-desaturase CrtD [Sphingobium algorifonticola]|uniref:Phytoene desaturase n=1 Tax=Sphingobium algorifonticola TaxID=2008318 RepID=A0A437J5L3_9SPHN|nr:1-hydroxycarotenoid 3,4-desaturase CrtD [Sphingobium algorifonticola]RVT40232.1 phytoene desaturase [Sphingobium algorifonticola]